MFNFDDFEVISYQPCCFKSTEPTITINETNIMFSRSCFKKLHNPEYVRYMIDPNGKRIAVQGSNKKAKDSIMLNPNRKSFHFGIYGCELISEIRHIISNWKDNERYKIQGEYFEEENVLVFNMKNAVLFEGGNNHRDRRLNK